MKYTPIYTPNETLVVLEMVLFGLQCGVFQMIVCDYHQGTADMRTVETMASGREGIQSRYTWAWQGSKEPESLNLTDP